MSSESSEDEPTRLEDSLLEIILGGAVSFFGIIGTRLAGFTEKVLVARFLDPSRYGQVVIALTILSLGSRVGMLGLNTAIVRYLPRFNDIRQKREVIKFSLGLAVGASVFLAILTYALSGLISTQVFDNASIKPVIRIFAIAIPFAAIEKMAVSSAQGLKDATWQNILGKGVQLLTRWTDRTADRQPTQHWRERPQRRGR